MSHFARIRRHPVFAPYFAAVHPFFWPILYWQLSRLIRWMKDENLSGALLGVTWWGQLHVIFPGDKNPDPNTYRPYALSRPRWDDPAWASDVPPCFATFITLEALKAALILPRAAGGGGWTRSVQTEGALPSQLLNTS